MKIKKELVKKQLGPTCKLLSCCAYLLSLAPSDPPTNVTAEIIENQQTYVRVTWTVRAVTCITDLELCYSY